MPTLTKVTSRISAFVRELAGKSELPLSVMLDIPKVTLIGEMQVQIENHRGIVLFSPDNVCVRTRNGTLSIKGNRLSIESVVKEEIIVHGQIDGVDFSSVEKTGPDSISKREEDRR